MRIFVAGATGVIGRTLIAQLLAKGHDVVALTHSPDRAKILAEQGIESAIRQSLRFAKADVFDAEALIAVIVRAQPEVVIEQLTALPKTYTAESM
ncbi:MULTISPECIES: NAD-dependent epimerase/dehydratase family protein, partial [unclassified Nostoc]|uniref:NAD-dependent epimerase/dehydratase family protein n=1 Tax=unclassified Nostoc TaxID=2593658 RepID=UPI00391B6874